MRQTRLYIIVYYVLVVYCLLCPVLPRPGESLDESGDCVVVAVHVLLTFVLVHGGGGVKHERRRASGKNECVAILLQYSGHRIV